MIRLTDCNVKFLVVKLLYTCHIVWQLAVAGLYLFIRAVGWQPYCIAVILLHLTHRKLASRLALFIIFEMVFHVIGIYLTIPLHVLCWSEGMGTYYSSSSQPASLELSLSSLQHAWGRSRGSRRVASTSSVVSVGSGSVRHLTIISTPNLII